MHKPLMISGSIAGGVAVLLGAMGAHALRARLSPESQLVFETAVRYQFYHVFAIIVCGMLCKQEAHAKIRWAGYLFIAGIVLFSGSLYLITGMQVNNKPISSGIGILTPVGGLFFIAGWILLAMGIYTRRDP